LKTIFKKFRVENSSAIEEAEAPLEKQGVVLIVGENLDEGGSNGASKSSFFEAFSHTCTGTTAKGRRKNELLYLKNPKNLAHILTFSKGPHEFEVHQYRAHSKHGTKVEIFRDGINVTPVSSVKNKDIAQDYIAECIGFSTNEFYGSLYLSQKFNHAMISGTPKERGQYLSSYFGLSSLDTLITCTKKRINGIQLPQEDELTKLKETVSSELTSYDKASIETELKNKGKEQQDLLQKQTTLRFELEKQKKAQDLVEKRKVIEDSLVPFELGVEDNLQEFLVSYRKDLQEFQNLKKQIELKEKLEKELQKFGALGELSSISYESLREEIEELGAEVARDKETLANIKIRIGVEKELSAIPSELVISTSLEEITEALPQKEEEHKQFANNLVIAQNELKKLLSLKGKSVCPTCLQSISEEKYKEMVEEKSTTATELKPITEELSVEISNIKDTLTTIKRYNDLSETLKKLPEGNAEVLGAKILASSEKLKCQNSLASKIVQISSINAQLSAIPEINATLEEVIAEISRLENKIKAVSSAHTWILSNGAIVFDLNEMSRIQNTLNNITERYNKAVEVVISCKEKLIKIEQLSKQIKDIQALLDKSRVERNRIKVLESIHVVLGDLRKMKLKESTELLTTVLPENIKRLFPVGNVGIEVTNDKGEFDLYLNRDGVLIPMDALSGGQEKRVGLAIVFAFAKMGSRTTNLLIADEIFKDLDPQGRKCAYELLMDLGMETVLITSHDQDVSMRSRFDQVWVMRMEGGRSKLYR